MKLVWTLEKADGGWLWLCRTERGRLVQHGWEMTKKRAQIKMALFEERLAAVNTTDTDNTDTDNPESL